MIRSRFLASSLLFLAFIVTACTHRSSVEPIASPAAHRTAGVATIVRIVKEPWRFPLYDAGPGVDVLGDYQITVRIDAPAPVAGKEILLYEEDLHRLVIAGRPLQAGDVFRFLAADVLFAPGRTAADFSYFEDASLVKSVEQPAAASL